MLECEGGADQRMGGQFVEAGFGVVQEAFRRVQAGVLRQIDKLRHQVTPGRLTLGDNRH